MWRLRLGREEVAMMRVAQMMRQLRWGGLEEVAQMRWFRWGCLDGATPTKLTRRGDPGRGDPDGATRMGPPVHSRVWSSLSQWLAMITCCSYLTSVAPSHLTSAVHSHITFRDISSSTEEDQCHWMKVNKNVNIVPILHTCAENKFTLKIQMGVYID